jgi:hypothetical protein
MSFPNISLTSLPFLANPSDAFISHLCMHIDAEIEGHLSKGNILLLSIYNLFVEQMLARVYSIVTPW